jgi:hypothetical protein
METFQIISTSVLGLIAIYIAWRHWWTDELKRRHDLYERRLKVYDALADFLGNFEKADGNEFLRQVRESRFLFSKEISDYLDKIYLDWLRYIAIRQIFADPVCRPEEPEFSKLSKEKGEIAERLKFQIPATATEKFAKEMSLNSPSPCICG